jgi:hypothetical protein
MSESSEFCRHNPLCCFSTSNTKGKRIFHYGQSPETFGYTLVIHLKLKAHLERLEDDCTDFEVRPEGNTGCG